MYKVISITDYEMTRDVELQNMDTGEIDLCFDDSALFSKDINFDFMKKGEIYDCKIKLFGVIESEKNKSNLKCRTIKILDYCNMVMAETNEGIYYIPISEFPDREIKNEFYYSYSRKDLIEVDGILHKFYR
jgi:hypothetical protein